MNFDFNENMGSPNTKYKMMANDSELIIHIDDNKKNDLEGFVDYSAIQKQNILLEEQIQKTKSEYSTDDQNAVYIQNKISTVNMFNFVLFLTYYVCVIAVIYVLLFLNTTYSLYTKVAIIVVSVFFPYIIPLVQKGILFIYQFILANIHGEVYSPST
jgi:hypothetical protein